MKVSIYIEKKDFDSFFTWSNRLSQGILSACPVRYSHTDDGFSSPLHVSLDAKEYASICDVVQDLNEIQEKMGGGEFLFRPEPLESERILMQGILKNARRYDIDVDVVHTAIEMSKHIPGITPLEALIIAEREWLDAGNGINNGDI